LNEHLFVYFFFLFFIQVLGDIVIAQSLKKEIKKEDEVLA